MSTVEAGPPLLLWLHPGLNVALTPVQEPKKTPHPHLCIKHRHAPEVSSSPTSPHKHSKWHLPDLQRVGKCTAMLSDKIKVLKGFHLCCHIISVMELFSPLWSPLSVSTFILPRILGFQGLRSESPPTSNIVRSRKNWFCPEEKKQSKEVIKFNNALQFLTFTAVWLAFRHNSARLKDI